MWSIQFICGSFRPVDQALLPGCAGFLGLHVTKYKGVQIRSDSRRRLQVMRSYGCRLRRKGCLRAKHKCISATLPCCSVATVKLCLIRGCFDRYQFGLRRRGLLQEQYFPIYLPVIKRFFSFWLAMRMDVRNFSGAKWLLPFVLWPHWLLYQRRHHVWKFLFCKWGSGLF